MTNQIKSLGLAGITLAGALAFGGCKRENIDYSKYNFEGLIDSNKVKFETKNYSANGLSVPSNILRIEYQNGSKKIFRDEIKDDLKIEILVYSDNLCNPIKVYSIKYDEDKKIILDGQREFNKYLHKIDSIKKKENKNKK